MDKQVEEDLMAIASDYFPGLQRVRSPAINGDALTFLVEDQEEDDSGQFRVWIDRVSSESPKIQYKRVLEAEFVETPSNLRLPSDYAEPIAIDNDEGLTQREWDAIANSVTNPAIVQQVLKDAEEAIEDGEQVEFAEPVLDNLSEPDLANLKSIIDQYYQDEVERFRSATLSKKDDILCVFEDEFGAGTGKTIKRFACRISKIDSNDPQVEYRQIAKVEGGRQEAIAPNSFEEAGILEAAFLFSEQTYEFKAKAKSGAEAKKKKNCTKGTACGGSCIAASKTCKSSQTGEKMSGENKAKAKQIKEKLKGNTATPEQKEAIASEPSSKRSDRPNTGKHEDIPDDSFTREKVQAIANLAGLSKQEARESFDSIRAFTLREYSEMRAFQRGRLDEVPDVEKTRARVEAANRFIENAPTFNGEVYRGMEFESVQERDRFYSSIRNGYEIEAMSSFSSSKQVAQAFASAGDESPGIVFRVANRSGVSIRGISALPQEDEVLIPKGTRYRPIGQPRRSGQTLVVTLEEF